MASSVSTPLGRAPLIPLVILGTGIYLTWFGVHYWRSDVKWPTDPIKDLLTGKGLPAANTPASYESQIDTAASSGSGSGTGAPSHTPVGGGDTSVHGGTAAQNQATGQLVAAAYGWAPTQNNGEWLSLVKLWNQESGWNNQAMNPSSGAYGIAQALGHGSGAATQGTVTNEYGGYGISDGMAQAANSGDAASQITWGLQYIKQTYGDPNAAWAHEVSAGWY